MTRSFITLAALGAGLTLFVAACGGDTDADSAAPALSIEAPASSTEATSQHEGDAATERPGESDLSSSDDIAEGSPAIWRLADDDTTVYLFGTVHLLSETTEWQSARLVSLFDAADAVYFETDDSPEAEAKMAALVPQLGLFTDGTTLNDFIEDEREAEIADFLSSLGLPPANVQSMRPWLTNIIVSVMLVQQAGGDPEKGVDRILGKRADEKGIPRRFFETTEEQIGFFADLSDQQSADLLVETIRHHKEAPDLFADLEAAWAAGKTEALWALVADSMAGYEWFVEILLFNRNERWAATLDTLMEEQAGTFFVAVGAGHLAGDRSVQHFMALKGHDAARL